MYSKGVSMHPPLELFYFFNQWFVLCERFGDEPFAPEI